jgi:hypothetical protein
MRDDAARVSIFSRTASLHEGAGIGVAEDDLAVVREMLGHEGF